MAGCPVAYSLCPVLSRSLVYRMLRRVDRSLICSPARYRAIAFPRSLACSLAGSPHGSLAHRLARPLLVGSLARKLANYAVSSVLSFDASLDRRFLACWAVGWLVGLPERADKEGNTMCQCAGTRGLSIRRLRASTAGEQANQVGQLASRLARDQVQPVAGTHPRVAQCAIWENVFANIYLSVVLGRASV